MELPPEAVVTICIEQGSVYHYRLDTVNHDGTPYSGDRFFIVLNANPKSDTVVVMTTITTKVEKQEKIIKKSGESPDTLVKISKRDFSHLSEGSAVNCNRIYEISLTELVEKIRNGGKVFHKKLPKDIVSALVSGALKSRQVSNEYKKLMI